MKISFDLDDVLFVSPDNYEVEPELRFPLNRMFPERLRKGTVRLIHELQDRGFEVWVYTSSFRSEVYIRTLFRYYNIRFSQIVNGYRHKAEVQGNRTTLLPQKLPNHYRISLHIDDELVICSYGKEYGFEAYNLDADDDAWKEKIIAKAGEVKRKWDRTHGQKPSV